MNSFRVTTVILLAAVGWTPAATLNRSVFATGTAIGTTSPDSVTFGDGSLWVAYQNGAASDGSSGSSIVARYSTAGAVLHQWTIAGNVDGLKVDPVGGLVWALQNNDGNSTLTTINPTTNATTLFHYGPSYTNPANRGFDDVVFDGGTTFLSETNPTGASDPVVLTLGPLASPLAVSGILNAGAITDPDSLKLLPNGDLALTGEADQTIVFIHNPGAASQSVTHLPLLGVGAGLPDDVIFPTATQGVIFYADTGANKVYRVIATGLSSDSTFIDVGRVFGSLDTSTGNVTPIFTGVSPHGADFVTFQAAGVPEPASIFGFLGGLTLLAALGWHKARQAKA